MKRLQPLLVILTTLLMPAVAWAQPAEWTPTPTNAAGTMLGTVTVNGAAAQAGDWVAAFDEGGTCAGAVEVILNAGQSFISLPIYGDDATTPGVDEGMNGGEAFTLRLWRSATGEILHHPDPEEPAALGGWTSTNGAPMPGYDDAYAVYDFAWDGPTLILDCPPSPMCLDGAVYNLTASPDNGAWEGPGVFAGFAGYFFDPAVAGYGTHTLTYTSADGLTDSCSVTVSETAAPTLDLPDFWCQGDGNLPLDGLAFPPGGTWTGTGVLLSPFGTLFDPTVVTPGTFPLTYTVEGNCGGTATANISVLPSPDAPTLTALDGLLYAGNIAGVDSIVWLIDFGAIGVLVDVAYTEPVFYFPTWGDVYYVQAVNEYGCTALSNPIAVDETIGVGGLAAPEPLRIWLDAHGRLQSNVPLEQVLWHDLMGRRVAAAHGNGPWLVTAIARDGRRVRRIFVGR